MRVRGLHHVNINVRSLDEALAFYTGRLGFEALDRPAFPFAGAWLRMGDDELHLVVDPEAIIDDSQHFALAVDDLDSCCRELDAAGVGVRRSPGSRQAFLRDPSGNVIELNEPAARERGGHRWGCDAG
jgi:catechol 2,3-dioxygenase-like lactoylglutathione lyase family enzyme